MRWKGLDVSDEFRRYAERVAQGEDLPPYQGRILAEPHPKFPWEPSERKRASRRAVRLQVMLWGSAAAVVGLLSWSLAVRFDGAAANLPAARIPAARFEEPAPPRGEAAPSKAVLAIRGAASAPEAPPPSTEAPARAASVTETAGLPARPAVSIPPALEAPAAQPPPRPAASVQRGQSVEHRAPASARPTVPPPSEHVPPPGAIREALGALLAARAEAGEFAPGSSGEEAATPAPAPAPASAEIPPAPAPARPEEARPVRKEPENESSGSHSLLVEAPPF